MHRTQISPLLPPFTQGIRDGRGARRHGKSAVNELRQYYSFIILTSLLCVLPIEVVGCDVWTTASSVDKNDRRGGTSTKEEATETGAGGGKIQAGAADHGGDEYV